MAKKKRAKKKSSNGNGANLGFEATLWLAADKLRNNLDAAEYIHGTDRNIGKEHANAFRRNLPKVIRADSVLTKPQ